MYRGEDGYTRIERASAMQGIKEFVDCGAQLGDLWMEGLFSVGDPLTRSGGRKRKKSSTR
jgi:hypothetical protein